jgi:hypothetical protein
MSKRGGLSAKRRNPQEMAALLEVVKRILAAQEEKNTVRHMCYRLEMLGEIPKTETGFATMKDKLADWRKDGSLPYDAFIDESRPPIEPRTFLSAEQGWRWFVRNYRQAMWANQPYHVEVWVEKQPLIPMLESVTWKWGVLLRPIRGFNSLTIEWESAQVFKAYDKVVILSLGDYDPSSQVSVKASERKIREHLWDSKCEFKFIQLAVTPQQIQEWKLPTRPTKEGSHSKKWTGGESAEIDAVPDPQLLRDVLEKAITDLIDWEKWEEMEAIQKAERDRLNRTRLARRRRR